MRWSCSSVATVLVVGTLFPVAASWGQESRAASSTKQIIDVYRGAPIKHAVDTLRQRYHLAITYEDPVYACRCDLMDIPSSRTPGSNLASSKPRRLHFEYTEINGRPQEDITSLIRRLLAQYAAQGEEVFDVQERLTAQGPEWNVIAKSARDSSGTLTAQPDVLGTHIAVPMARRTEAEFLGEMLQQLRIGTGYTVILGTVETSIDKATGDLGADNVSARDLLSNMCGTSLFWELDYDPEGDGRFVLNIGQVPRTPQPLNAYIATRTAPPQPTGPVHAPPNVVVKWATRPGGIRHLQSILAQDGYYTGAPTGNWDENTIDAVKKGQAAHNLPVTGQLDPETIRKLGLDVVTPRPQE